MEEVVNLVAELGFPIAAAILGGFFMFLTLKYIMDAVIEQVKSIEGMVGALDNRVKTMNNDMVGIGTNMSLVFGIKPDLKRLARADGKEDARRD